MAAARPHERLRTESRGLSPASGSAMLAGAAAAQAACSYMILGLPSIGPQLRNEFALSLPALGALLATMQFGTGVALIFAGKAADRWGARASTRVGTLAAAAGLAFGAALHSVIALFVGLFFAGVASAIVPVAGARAIFRNFPASRRAFALGVRQMAVPVGGMIAAASVPALFVAGGSRLVLAVGAVVVAVSGAVFAAVSDETRVQHARSVKMVRGIWHGAGLGRLLTVSLCYLFVLQTVLVYTVPAMRAAGFSAVDAGIAYFVVNATAIVSRLAWARIADRDDGTRRRRSLVESGAMASVGALLFGLALHGSLAVTMPALIFYGFAALGWNALVYAMAGEWTTPELSGRAFAVAASIVFTSSAVVSSLIGALADSVGWDALWIITAVVGMVGVGAAWALPQRGVEAVGTDGVPAG